MALVQSQQELETTSKLAYQIWHEYYTSILGEDQVNYMVENFQSAGPIQKQIENGVIYRNIYFDGQPAGYFAIEPQGEKMFLSKFYISSAFRGKGIFKATLSEIMELSKGMKHIYLTVNKHNADSIAVYKKLGFYQIDSIETDIGNGFVMDDYVMQKDI